MLQFAQDDTEAILTLTLTENVSITDAYFLFVFTHVLTNATVSFIKFSGSDESDFRQRYNQYTINPSVTFLNKPIGQYNYTVYEQASSTNTDVSLTGTAIQYGKLIVDRATAFTYTQYSNPLTATAYNG